MRLRRSIVCVIVGLTVSAWATPAAAEPALIAIDNATPALEQADNGDWSGTLGLTNLTDNAVSLSAAPTKPAPACKLKLSKAAIGSAQSSKPKITVPKTCKIVDASFELTLTARGATKSQRLPIVAEAKAGDDPDWTLLRWFFYALPFVGFILWIIFLRGHEFSEKLTYLDATYSFKESWVSNITVLAGLLTGVFGSADVVKAFLGEDADSAVALATVGSAIALVLISSGPIFLNALKKEELNDAGQFVQQSFTRGGLLLATTVTVAGAFGQLLVGWQSAETLDLDGVEDCAVLGFAIAVLLLGWYTLATVGSTIKEGTTPPPPPAPSEVAQLASLLEGALTRNVDVPNKAIPSVIQDVMSYPIVGTSRGDEPPLRARRRSAMP